MNDTSVSSIRLPSLSAKWSKEGVSRRALLAVLQRLKVGSLTVHDGEEVLQFGDQEDTVGPVAVVNVHDRAAYAHILSGGTLGAGESFMLAQWSSPDLVSVIRLFCANMQIVGTMDQGASWWRELAWKAAHSLNKNSLKGSRRNIAAHYDLGNEFFELFLDQSMMYSSAVFPEPDASLEAAAEHKLDLICQQLELQPDDHLLEIGTGWGGMALHAATRYGCKVTTTTVSREQYDYARKRVAEAGLSDRITLLCEDYRDLRGSFDKLVSIEMIEAVGHNWYSSYFRQCSELLKADGLMVIQAITMADQRYEEARDSVDFIKRYVFPGGCLPSLEVIGRHTARDTDMQIIDLRDITADYARTLACWRERFMAALPQVREQGFDTLFERLWEFYLCYCEGGFSERVIGTVQLKFAKPGYRFQDNPLPAS